MLTFVGILYIVRFHFLSFEFTCFVYSHSTVSFNQSPVYLKQFCNSYVIIMRIHCSSHCQVAFWEFMFSLVP